MIPSHAYRQSHSDGAVTERMRSCVEAVLAAPDDDALLRVLTSPWPEGVRTASRPYNPHSSFAS